MTSPTSLPAKGSNQLEFTPTDLARAVWVQVSEIKTALAIAGALLYFVIRGVYAGFYGTLKVDPAEAGHGHADILEAAALGLGLWFLIAVAATTLLTAITVARSSGQVSLADKRVVRAGFSWSLVVLALTPVITVIAPTDFVANFWNVVGICLYVALLVSAVAFSRSERFRLGTVLAGILILLLTAFIAHRWGTYEAGRAMLGEEVSPGALGLINIRVDRVCLLTASREPALRALTRRRVGYLGSQEPYSLLLIPGANSKVLRVPSSVYTTVSTNGAC